MHSNYCVFFNSIQEVKLVPHFPVLYFPILEIWFLIFQLCWPVFDLFGLSLVPHFPVLHFHSMLLNAKNLEMTLKVYIDCSNGANRC